MTRESPPFRFSSLTTPFAQSGRMVGGRYEDEHDGYRKTPPRKSEPTDRGGQPPHPDDHADHQFRRWQRPDPQSQSPGRAELHPSRDEEQNRRDRRKLTH
jgi:hypothetical protein